MILYISENHIPYSVGIVNYYVDYALTDKHIKSSIDTYHVFDIQNDRLIYYKYVNGEQIGLPFILEKESDIIYFATLCYGKYPVSLVRYCFAYDEKTALYQIIKSLNESIHESLLTDDINLEVHKITFDNTNTIVTYSKYRYDNFNDDPQYMYTYTMDYSIMWREYLDWPKHIEIPKLKIGDKVIRQYNSLDDAYDLTISKDTKIYTVLNIDLDKKWISAYTMDKNGETGIGNEDDFIGLYKKLE